ncbi:unnamed protein product [Caenorhabditis angaria]|uniref:Uncharacterized protein n=1 Tax=Caenorhabditis angaria TaxID=860376 RepID=A0A9P1IDW7_9PELO|nr:unnamed protein product [Caenorhabditis angaria]
MTSSIKLMLLLFCSLYVSEAKNDPMKPKDFDEFRLDKKGFDKVRTIHTNWYVHSMKALISQLSRNLLPKLSPKIKYEFQKCLYKIHDMKDLVESAKCLMEAREKYDEWRKTARIVPKPKKYDNKIRKINSIYMRKNGIKINPIKLRGKSYLEFKNKWRKPLKIQKNRVKRSLRRLVVDTVSKSDSNGYVVKNMEKMPDLKSTDSKSTVKKVTDLLKSFVVPIPANKTEEPWSETYNAILALKKKMSQREKEPGARVYNQRMYDLVLDRKPIKSSKIFNVFNKPGMPEMPGIFKQAFDLMSAIEGSGKKSSSNSNYKFLSPRFASIMPDKNENHGKLSPSILSFYNDESEDQILPLPKMLESTGLKGKDRDNVIEMVMELSGAKTIVQEAIKILKAVDLPELDLAVSSNAKKSIEMVHEIKQSFNQKQKNYMDTKGFAIMEPKQIEKLMAEQGLAGRDDIFNVKDYAKKTMFERKEMVWDMVRQIAYGPASTQVASNSTGRFKRQAINWGPHVLQPTVLSPILFAPIYGLNVLAPTVLSPGLFTPLILNPAVLSPYVFSPTVGIPFILSPYVLSPYVFSPLVMAPFILTPYVLSPNVFNPYVLSPLILSPLVICPDVVSPMTLGGAILSPGVLSPSVLSKSYIMANVLSPTFLS